jgi:L-alanine-DL-glutamate epimerase-like enolase superfamily enzyme
LTRHDKNTPRIVSIELTPVIIPSQEVVREAMSQAGGLAEDVSILQAMRKQFGGQVRIRVDYNQAYSPEEAVKTIEAHEPYGIEVAEQPISRKARLQN